MAVNTAVATTGNTALSNGQPKVGIATYLGSDAVRANIAGVIGEKNVTRFISSVVSAGQINPALAVSCLRLCRGRRSSLRQARSSDSFIWCLTIKRKRSMENGR